MAESQKALKVYLVSLGCAKNLVDSERILGLFESLRLAPADSAEEADLAFINTCAFIREAEEEALETIFSVRAALKPGARLVVSGCLPSRRGEDLLLPEADLLIPRSRYGELPELIAELMAPLSSGGADAGPEERESSRKRSGRKGPEQKGARKESDASGPGKGPPAESGSFSGGGKTEAPPPGSLFGAPGFSRRPFESWERVLSTPPWRAYLKIAEGCNHRCAYCVIPKIRGKLASASLESLAAEAGRLADSGAIELTLVAQDLTAWKDGDQTLADLVERLSEIQSIKWIRLMYCYPERITKSLLSALRTLPKAVPYLDVPFQHVSKKILASMGRLKNDPYKTIELIRSFWPEAAVRSTFMTRFPGEAEDDFNELRRFLESAKLDHAGFFAFSPEEGSRAALFSGQIPEALKESGRMSLFALQEGITESLSRLKIGKTFEVLTDGPSPESDLITCGRASFQAPEADGLIYFEGVQPEYGRLVKARITKAGGFDLAAVLAGAEDGLGAYD